VSDERNDRPAEEPNPAFVAPEDAGPVHPHEATDSLEELQELAVRYKEEAERNWQQFLHAAADLENYKKQAARQREEAVQRARTSLLAVMLTVVDNLERALAHAGGDPKAVIDGIRMTHRQILDVLAGLGVQALEAQGKVFDPRFHEAVDVAAHTEAGVTPGTVITELQRGYLLNGEVLRPARVRVAK
jgi:molecular chaperone GrpE